MSLFTQAEAERIAAAITEVERRTAGEIVVAEEPRSDDYAEVRLAWAFGLGLAGAAALHLLWPAGETGVLFAVEVSIAALVWLATNIAGVLRALLPRVRARDAVMRAARLAFLQYGVFRTRDRTGVLIFLSALEHRVVILGDEAIDQKLGKGWDALVAKLTAAIRAGRAGDGVCDVIRELGPLLERDAPIQPDDANELANHVRGSVPHR